MIPAYEPWAAGFLLFVALFAVFESHKLTLGGFSSPGPGFFPFYLSLAFCVVCLLLLIRSFLPQGKDSREPVAGERPRRDKVVWTLLALVGYAFGLEPLGFVVATFLLMLFLTKVIEPRRWLSAIGGSLTISVLSYALFRILQVRLPAGIWVR